MFGLFLILRCFFSLIVSYRVTVHVSQASRFKILSLLRDASTTTFPMFVSSPKASLRFKFSAYKVLVLAEGSFVAQLEPGCFKISLRRNIFVPHSNYGRYRKKEKIILYDSCSVLPGRNSTIQEWQGCLLKIPKRPLKS